MQLVGTWWCCISHLYVLKHHCSAVLCAVLFVVRGRLDLGWSAASGICWWFWGWGMSSDACLPDGFAPVLRWLSCQFWQLRLVSKRSGQSGESIATVVSLLGTATARVPSTLHFTGRCRLAWFSDAQLQSHETALAFPLMLVSIVHRLQEVSSSIGIICNGCHPAPLSYRSTKWQL